MEFIDSQKALYPDLAELYTTLGNLHEHKLWHQLSIALEDFVSEDKNVRGDNVVLLYKNFVAHFEARLNQVKLATLVSLVARTMTDAPAIEFLAKVLESRERLGNEAAMCLDMDTVTLKLRIGDVAGAKEMVDGAKAQLSLVKATESVVFSKYYKALTEYKKEVGPPNEFYSAALLFLSYTSVEEMSASERVQLATDIALASITGDDIYNFGEVLATPILSCLADTENAWLLQLVEAMNIGSVPVFTSLLEAHKTAYFKQAVLADKHEIVLQKIVLLSILNICFERPSHDRVIAFADIASRSAISPERVEWVLMRAMSLGLIKGTIDEVDAAVNITWVQPRVLDRDQLKMLSEQLGSWTDKVKSTLVTIEDQTAELYV
ncbi:26S proteasome subunit like protein [Ochromonadaceae sp. CCMP2298]|nr:26S proteasome subunit like protein [Ochromonadaceae sp. CCMP2298]|eukprot:CAMPEP_0173200708 /NCGR_PEP_ID=MMETSP1141-20130122/17938_1 /TAXON_ID=483371 /ORGANISM="non described non described, Strain CCMP2298" /LENGTH=377 /DNA_ID=CAMNT_0014125733 /DNA_START=23 /DNA_END=1156 /DNA_ORIENTATION=+